MTLLKTLLVWLKRILLLLWCLVLALIVVKFYLDNTDTLNVVIYRWTLQDVAVSQYSFVLLGGGMGVAILAFLPWVLLLRARLMRANAQLNRARTALQSLPASAVKPLAVVA